MSYTGKTWQNGDIITATELNSIENGIRNSQSTADSAQTAASTANSAIRIGCIKGDENGNPYMEYDE